MIEIKNNFDTSSMAGLLDELEKKEEFSCGVQIHGVCGNCSGHSTGGGCGSKS